MGFSQQIVRAYHLSFSFCAFSKKIPSRERSAPDNKHWHYEQVQPDASVGDRRSDGLKFTAFFQVLPSQPNPQRRSPRVISATVTTKKAKA
jgi:hypothetical protein